MTSRAPPCSGGRLDLIQTMNRRLLQRVETDRRMEGMIESFELAFRMQTETPGLVDLSGETRGDQRSVRHRPAGDRSPRPGLPAGPPAQRGGRSLRPGDDRRLGPPRQHPGCPAQKLRRIGSARRRPDQGSQVARPARRHAGGLVGRVRPHPVEPGPLGHVADRHPRPRASARELLRRGSPAAA